MLKKVFAIFFVCFLTFPTSLFALPQPDGYVNDYENILKNKEEIESKVSEFEEQTGIEIAVVTIADFDDSSLEDYAVRIFEEWGIGKEGEDNGVLVLVSKEQRQSRIEVGYGLEPILTDGITGRIQDVAMVPNFQEGRYSEGINEGVDMIIGILSGEEVAQVTTAVNENAETEAFGCLGAIFFVFLLLVPNPFISGIVGGFLGAFIGMVMFGITGATIGGIVGLFLGFLLGFIARLIPAPVRHGVAYTMMSAGRRGGGGGSSFGGFGGGMSGGGGSSRSW